MSGVTPSQLAACPALRVRGLEVAVPASVGEALAVRGIDLDVAGGETVAIVGESGCGKTLTALAIAGLLPEGLRVPRGEIALQGESIAGLSESAWRAYRGARIAMVFQDPTTALNPVHKVGSQIVEAILAHQRIARRDARNEALALLERVSLTPTARCFDAYPHQLSGGMRQRAQIAMAIANRPAVLIADEPTTALDATVQAGLLALLRELQLEAGMALVLITHDLRLVTRNADRVVVMYAGRPVETGPTGDVLGNPQHPYTRALLRARPQRRGVGGPRVPLVEIVGRVPPLASLGAGCAFAGRCEVATAACTSVAPPARGDTRRTVWCHVQDSIDVGACEEASA
ncbi:oligopeptide/dipeptide ABC transporter, ATP-binding protein, C-terminal domain-containing protein [Burkholderia sp. CF099]|nr:oligopeptide/dipeptide ABC transporter, ATP-binding protein, C-terminal domain-containing protein [Burkholderia sp. CF099]